MTDSTPTIDGMTLPSPGHGTPIETATEATILALESAGLIEPRHAAMCELARSMAAAIGASTRYGRGASQGLAVCARELREALAALPAPEGGPADDAWDQLAAALRDADARDAQDTRATE